jgi:hypothetical protein
MLKYVVITLVAAAVLWELKALYTSWASFSRAELARIHELPMTDRPNRRGHFLGNFVRFLHHHWRRRFASGDRVQDNE